MQTMKRISTIIAAGLALLSAFSCVKEEQKIIYDLSNATAPVLGTWEQTKDGISAAYTPATFGFNDKMVSHSLALVSVDGAAVNQTLNSSAKENVVSVGKTTLNKALIALGKEEGSFAAIELVVRAAMPGASDYIDSQARISISDFEIAKGNPWGEYTETSPWSLIGAIESLGMSWDGDYVMYSNGNKHVARAVTLKTTDQFKFRKDKAWGENFGGEGSVEPFVLAVDTEYKAVAGGKNFGVPADGVYDLLLDLDANTVTISEAYLTYPDYTESSAWGVTGAIASAGISWDLDIAMITNGEWHVAEGVVLTTTDQFKFRKDRAWGENFGGEGSTEPFVMQLDVEYEAVAGGKNLGVPADGTYDLFLNPEAKIIKIVESLGGKSPVVGGDEPGPEPDPVIENAWSLIGGVGDTAWDKDFYMTEADGIWTSDVVSFKAGSEFKLRFNNSWDDADCVGAPEKGFEAPVGEAFTGVQPGENIVVAVAGDYQVVFDPATLSVTLVSMANRFSVIGEVNGSAWDKDFYMNPDGDIWTSGELHVTGGFKIRFNCSWDDADCYGAPADFTPTVGEAFEAAQPGGNIVLEEGDYVVTFDAAQKTILIQPALPGNLWSVIGGVSGSSWDKDFYMTETDGIWVSDALEFTESSEFKLRFNNSWADADTFGGAEDGIALTPGVPIVPAHPGANLKVAEPGTYHVVYDSVKGVVYLQGWALIGNVSGTSWDRDFLMTVGSDGRWWSDAVRLTGEFKLRRNGSWDDADTRGYAEKYFQFVPGTAFSVIGPGENINIPTDGAGYYTVAFDPEKGEVTIYRSEWALIGKVGGTSWDKDFFLVELESGVYTSAPVVLGGEFKLRRNGSWDDADTRGAVESGFAFTPGTAFTVTGPGANIGTPAEGTYVVTYTPAAESVTITAQ